VVLDDGKIVGNSSDSVELNVGKTSAEVEPCTVCERGDVGCEVGPGCRTVPDVVTTGVFPGSVEEVAGITNEDRSVDPAGKGLIVVLTAEAISKSVEVGSEMPTELESIGSCSVTDAIGFGVASDKLNEFVNVSRPSSVVVIGDSEVDWDSTGSLSNNEVVCP